MATVRYDFSEDADWRKVLGNAEPLYCFAVHGYSLDAPENMPAGGTKSCTVSNKYHAQGLIFYRGAL